MISPYFKSSGYPHLNIRLTAPKKKPVWDEMQKFGMKCKKDAKKTVFRIIS
jgi:hypothetical protein